MNTSQKTDGLYKALLAFQSELALIGKDATNPFLRNKYTSLDSLVEAIQPIMAKHQLGIIQALDEVTEDNIREIHVAYAEKGERLPDGTYPPPPLPMLMRAPLFKLTTRIFHAGSDEFVDASVLFPVAPQKGISFAQAVGVLDTYLRRYQIQNMLRIASEDDDGCGAGNDKGSRSDPNPKPNNDAGKGKGADKPAGNTNAGKGAEPEKPAAEPSKSAGALAPEERKHLVDELNRLWALTKMDTAGLKKMLDGQFTAKTISTPMVKELTGADLKVLISILKEQVGEAGNGADSK